MKVYHYTKLEDWAEIKRGGGLVPQRIIGREDQEARETKAIFGFLEPIPKEWVENQDFPEVWEWLKRDIGGLLLEVEIDPGNDRIFVVDWGHREGFHRQDISQVPERYDHKTRKEAERAYVESKIQLKDYLEKKDTLNYSIPEVIIAQSVPLDKLSISEQQPLIEDRLERLKEFEGSKYEKQQRSYLEFMINNVGLGDWLRKYYDKKVEIAQEINMEGGHRGPEYQS